MPRLTLQELPRKREEARREISQRVGDSKAQITVHLGDVYYAGTSDEELHLFASLWPPGSFGSFALNSNHEMYSGAKPYFLETLANDKFLKQGGCSYFALENTNWVIVGLDSAYFSNPESMYMDGSLAPAGGPKLPFESCCFARVEL